MKLIKTFILIVVVLFLVYFLTQNNARVFVDLVFIEFNDASVSMVIFGSLSIGIILGYLFLEEQITSKVIISVLAVIIGIYFVKRGNKIKII